METRRDRLISDYLSYAVKVAVRTMPHDPEEAESIALLSLVRAVDAFLADDSVSLRQRVYQGVRRDVTNQTHSESRRRVRETECARAADASR